MAVGKRSTDDALHLRMDDQPFRIAVVAGPVVVHTGGVEHFASLIKHGYVDIVLAGNALAVHDVDGDGFDDVFVGGGVGTPGRLFLQGKDGRYTPAPTQPWEAAKAAMLRRIAGDGRSLPQDRLHAMMERFISGGGTFPVIGSYDEVAATLKRLSDAGLDGMALASVNYVQEMPVIRDELLPRLERLGLREPLH